MVALMSVPGRTMPGRNLADRSCPCWTRGTAGRKQPKSGRRSSGCAIRPICAKAQSRPIRASGSPIRSTRRPTPGPSGCMSTASWRAPSGCTSPRGSPPICRPSTSSPTCSPRRSVPARPSSTPPGSFRPRRLEAISGVVLRDDAARMAGVGFFPDPPAAGDRADRTSSLLPANFRSSADLRPGHYPRSPSRSA